MLCAVSLQHHMPWGLTCVNTALASEREGKKAEEGVGWGWAGGWVKGRKVQNEEEECCYFRDMCEVWSVMYGVDDFERF